MFLFLRKLISSRNEDTIKGKKARNHYSELTAARELMRTSNATGSAVPKSALSRGQNDIKNI